MLAHAVATVVSMISNFRRDKIKNQPFFYSKQDSS